MLCIYCLKREATTVDHVPPKGLFPKPRPNNINLISVPACEPRNQGFQEDDNYFLGISLEWKAAETVEGRRAADARMRDLNSGKRRGLWHPIFATLKPVEAHTPAGLYLGKTLEFSLNGDRVFRTIHRVIRGLYYEVTKTPLPKEAVVVAMEWEDYLKKHGNDPNTQDVIDSIRSLPVTNVGDGQVFQFRNLLDGGFDSFWGLEFYRSLRFVGFTSSDGKAFAENVTEIPPAHAP